MAAGPNAGSVRAQLILENGEWKRKVAGAKEDMRGLGRQAHRTSKDIKAIQKASAVMAAAVAAAVGSTVLVAAKFEQKLQDIKAVSGATGAEMSKLKELAIEMGKKTKFSSAEAAQGM